jgi:hypothetical protein
MASAAALAVVRADAAGAATVPAGGITVWRLNADWGYPVGPKNKTRCACNACVRRAENGYFRSKTAAIAGRIHPCCVCQPYKTTIADISSADLFNGESSADLRDARVAAVFGDVSEPAADPIAVPTGVDGLPSDGTAATNPSPVPSAAAVSGFARTGSTLKLPAIGAAMVAAGGALIAFRNRGATASAAVVPDPVSSPTNRQTGASS